MREAVRLLSSEVIHRIAAGEVVDRPAAILKELIENSLDAGAGRVKVTVVEGGLRAIEVEDDGLGLTREDLANCVQRHATSKIRSLDDLDAIHSLGFRGEALSAAASVSRLSIDTFSTEDKSWILEVIGGQRSELRPSTRRSGTKVKVEDLFFNVPARRKFLKRPGSEAEECVDTFISLALARPEISFEIYIVNEKGELKKQLNYPRASLAERFIQIHAARAEVLLIEKTYSDNEGEGIRQIAIAAYKPPASQATQKSIRLSINGRPVYDRRLPYALREAYSGLIEINAFPIVQVNVEVDPRVIDVNIHPQKKEIRWPSGFSLAGKVYNLLRPNFEVAPRPSPRTADNVELFGLAASLGDGQIKAVGGEQNCMDSTLNGSDTHLPRQASVAQITQPPTLPDLNNPENQPRSYLSAGRPRMLSNLSQPNSQLRDSIPNFSFRELRVVGEVGAAWIVTESPRGLVLIDQHAAHERINFERILLKPDLIRSKALLMPMRLELPLGVQGSEATVREALERCAFEFAEAEITDSGGLEILAVPESDRKIDWAELIQKVFRDIATEDLNAARLENEVKIRLAASLACHGSVRRGQRLSADSIRALLEQMDSVQWGAFCPHGRPLWFELAHEQIENLFHR